MRVLESISFRTRVLGAALVERTKRQSMVVEFTD